VPEFFGRGDAYLAALRDNSAKYGNANIPEPTHAASDWLAVWSRTLRVVFVRLEGGSATEVLGKVYRLADRIAVRVRPSRGFAFVEMAEGAEEAIQALHTAQFGGGA
jgi:hypothetical protein